MADKALSVLAKLKNKAKHSGKSFNLYLQLFCQEEFLRRLSNSRYVDNLVLKGGLFIYTLTNFESRATIDVDFLLQHQTGTIEQLENLITDVLNTCTENDFISFDMENFEYISPQRKYAGISFKIIGKIKNTRTPFNIDIGIGDVVIPNCEKREIPVQLEGYTIPKIYTYSLESTIAEKFDAMITLLELNSRMKDFYDIYYLSRKFNFNGSEVLSAIKATFKTRNTPYTEKTFQDILEFKNNSEMNSRWMQFLKRLKLDVISFDEVINQIDIFITPIWNSIITSKDFNKNWNSITNEWK